ncbi:MAG: hypothetical protein ABID54_00275 [Pseudomonadota bacterium]
MEIGIDKLTIENIKQYNPVLFKAIQESTDPNEEIKTLTDKVEAEATTNQELSRDNEDLKKENEDLKKENDQLKGENDTFKAEKSLSEKKIAVNKLVEEAKLPKELKTEFFMESLLKLDDEEIKKAIEERQHIAEATKGKVTESGEEFVLEGGAKVTDAKKKEVVESIRA